MKPLFRINIFTIFFLFLFIPGLEATTLTFTESFLAGDDHFELWEDYSATFAFDLTAQGDYGKLFDKDGDLLRQVMPNPDVVDFFPAGYNLDAATLDLKFSSRDSFTEQITVKAGFLDGDGTLFEKEYDLGVWYNSTRYYADKSLDLMDLGLGDYLSDGEFVAIVLAFDYKPWWNPHDNDFRLDEISLNLTASEVPSGQHAPEPASFLLLGSGLLGLCYRTRRKQLGIG